ncbi:MAG: carbohydrate ABC transporter permease [Clostridiales bacterium]|nr:carbohydrate ABC transporter permease [Clostridiales bacterium]MDO4349501.1 carbohydrate ABC transporter permease [Eubacteriales bacterium]MDY4009384.1 carbohydrate ABC transporter permease [Candidatus Limiplasma sp.]
MAKTRTNDMMPDSMKMNRIRPRTNTWFNVLFIILAAAAIIPVVFVFMISISSEESIRLVGYSFVPQSFSGSAYQFLWNERATILQALFISVSVTVLGTLIGLALTTTMGYVLSRPAFKLKSFYTWVVFIPMIFNGGMVASYVVNANILGLKNTIWALILPLTVSSFNIIICKTFFRSTVPDSIIESAKIDGANQLRIFGTIVLPISKPVLATIGLFLTFGYWNDWFQSSLYITDSKLVSLQALLNNMMKSLDYIANNPSAGVSLQQYRNQMPSESVRMAIAIVIVVPIACAYPFFQKYFISGLTIGAVKG